MKLLSLLPTCRDGGITLIAQGLFAQKEDIQRLTTDIMKKISKSKIGKEVIGRLNQFFLFQYHKLLQ